jgi:hypothetical protein
VHAFDIIPRVAPIASGVEVAKIERVFQTGLDAGNAARDLARHESLAVA